MRVFETTLDIQPDGRAVLHLPEGLGPGVRKAVVVLEDRIEGPPPNREGEAPAEPAKTGGRGSAGASPSQAEKPLEPLPLPRVPVTGSGSIRREDLYGERGR